MWRWLHWPLVCYCCSAWHWSAVAGTSPSGAPRDQPDLVPCSSLHRRDMIFLATIHSLFLDTVIVQCVGVGFISPRLLSLGIGAAVGQGHRPEHFRVRSFPVRQACCSSLHCSINTHIYVLYNTPAMKREVRVKMNYWHTTNEIFMR